MLGAMERQGYRLKPYQIEGVAWMASRERCVKHRGGILADDPGLGKTIQTIALLLENKVDHTLIIVPTAVLHQWYEILIKFFGEDDVLMVYGSKFKSTAQWVQESFTICLTTHGTISTSMRTILHFPYFWDRVVVDEAHVMRNHKTKIHKSICALRYNHTCAWALTGTPIQNSSKDMVNLLKFIGIPPSKKQQDLGSLIQQFVLRRTKEIIMDDVFVPHTTETISVPFDTKLEQDIYDTLYKNALWQMANPLLRGRDRYLLGLELIIRLRQCAFHPHMALQAMSKKYSTSHLPRFPYATISSKMSKIITDINHAKGYCLVFCHFIKEMELIQLYLKQCHRIKSTLYNGGHTIRERKAILNTFSSDRYITRGELILDIISKPSKSPVSSISTPDYWSTISPYMDIPNRVLIIQIKSGGVGLNLQQFSNVFISSPDWNPTNEIQAISRAHRLGQSKQVVVKKYVLSYNSTFGKSLCRNTIDERILMKQYNKRAVMSALLEDETLVFSEDVSSLSLDFEQLKI